MYLIIHKMFGLDWVYSNFAGDNNVHCHHFICHYFMCEIVIANVCLFHLNVACLAPLPIVKLEKEKL